MLWLLWLLWLLFRLLKLVPFSGLSFVTLNRNVERWHSSRLEIFDGLWWAPPRRPLRSHLPWCCCCSYFWFDRVSSANRIRLDCSAICRLNRLWNRIWIASGSRRVGARVFISGRGDELIQFSAVNQWLIQLGLILITDYYQYVFELVMRLINLISGCG